MTLNCQVKMIGEAARRGEKLFEGRALGDFAFLRLAAVAAGVEVLVEKAADIEFVEGIGFGLLRNFLGFSFQEGFVAVVVGLRGLLRSALPGRDWQSSPG